MARMSLEQFRKLQKDGKLPGKHAGRKPPKYKNKRTFFEGQSFASRREAARYGELLLLKAAGEIKGEIELQQRIRCEIDGVHVCDYICDFWYTLTEGHQLVIEDCKGVKTALYRLKKKLVKALYGYDILET